MHAGEAKAIASQWIREEMAPQPGFEGAFFHGSINWLAADAALSPSSDLDIMVVFADPPPVKLGKFVVQGVMLEISYLPAAELRSAEQVLQTSHLAGSFHRPSVIADPNDWLIELQQEVMAGYAKEQWVRTRCANTQDKLLRYLQQSNVDAPFHDQVTSWLFGTSLTTHLPLLAGLENPTVRRRYLAVRELLRTYGYLDFHEDLLALLGCAQLTQAEVADHLAALTTVFDVTKGVIKSPFFFASDISDDARAIAIDGSQTMIENGDHREAIFWIVATYARCLKVLHEDAPTLYEQHASGFHHLLAALGVQSQADLPQRAAEVETFLPQLMDVTDAILAANPRIERAG